MRTVLIDTLPMEAGKIFMIISGRRIKLSDCSVKAELYELQQNVNAIGDHVIKRTRASLVICGDVDSSECDFERVTGFEICAEVQRPDGIYERIFFHNLAVKEINEHGSWEFEVMNHDQVNRLFELAL